MRGFLGEDAAVFLLDFRDVELAGSDLRFVCFGAAGETIGGGGGVLGGGVVEPSGLLLSSEELTLLDPTATGLFFRSIFWKYFWACVLT